MFKKTSFRKLQILSLTLLFSLPLGLLACHAESSSSPTEPPALSASDFIDLLEVRGGSSAPTLQLIKDSWELGYSPMIVELIYFSRDRSGQIALMNLLQEKTDLGQVYDFDSVYKWLWKSKIEPVEFYPEFKSKLYARIDKRFGRYFTSEYESSIRLDEVRWGGVQQNGIPPLRSPKMIDAGEADYLEDSNVVFGVAVNGDFRAYPKRILAWHEMFIDDVGGESLTGVYCTLCGSVILYKNNNQGQHFELGTSGFLYRSNKLMFDEKKYSLWSTLEGEPVMGPLVGKGIKLEQLPVVTTTWGKWKKLHPNTTVLSLNTGHKRDYAEGAAYRDYFATDRLMFTVPFEDKRLANKAEIFAFHSTSPENPPLAISSQFLKDNPIYNLKFHGQPYLIITDSSGAHRAYRVPNGVDFSFSILIGDSSLKDSKDRVWTISEDKIGREGEHSFTRFPAHNAFWFGWHAAFPNTELIH